MIQFQNYKKNIKTRQSPKISDLNEASYNGDVGILRKYEEKKEDSGKQPLAAAIVGVNNTAAPLHYDSEFIDTWTDIDALELFLSSKPTCYLILGKPGAGAYILGEAISKKYNCIHLCPKNILIEEIERKTPTGDCVHFNLKHNKAITFEIFIKMLKIKAESSVIQHRGYVISGFPLVTCSRSPHYYVNYLHGEESVAVNNKILFDTIANLKKQKKKKPRKTSLSSGTSITSDTEVPGEDEEDVEEEPEPEEHLGEEEQELKVELPKFLLDTCSDVINSTKSYFNSKKVVLLKQLDDLFSLNLKPDIIIYLSSPDKDLVIKKTRKYIDYKTQHVTVEPFISKISTELRWPLKYTTSDDTAPFDTRPFKPKYVVRQPMNFPKKSVEQICNYNHDILPFLEKKLKDFNPKCVIKVDGRLSLYEMLHEVSERLLIMNVKPVIKPQPLLMEEVPDDIEEFWKITEELNVIRSGTAAFLRCASPWLNRCPVELKKRVCKRGNPKLAITFMKYIFLTATLDNLISFYKNPRPYLKLKYLEPTCRIIVIGTKLSGKTMISECLSWLFDTPVISYNDVLQKEVTKKFDIYAKTVLSEIIATIEDSRFAKWQTAEMERLENLDNWCKSTLTQLKKYVPLLREYINKQKEEKLKPRRKKNVVKEQRRKEPKEREGPNEGESLKKDEQPKEGEVLEEGEAPKEEKVLEEGEAPKEEKLLEEREAPKEGEELEKGEAPKEGEQSREDEVEGETEDRPLIDPEFMKKINNYRDRLSFLPFLDNLDDCEDALSIDVISKYAPVHITTSKPKPMLPILGDEDVTKAIAAYIEANDLQKDIEPTVDEMMDIITNMITAMDDQHQQLTNMDEMYGKYIIDDFPSDIECWNTLAESDLLPDYTISLVENREFDPELLKHYKIINDCLKHHQDRYVLANDPLIKTKLKLQSPPGAQHLNMKNIVEDVIKNFNKVDKEDTVEFDEVPETEPWLSFSENVEKFKEDWDNIKNKLEEHDKCFIEVQLENKSDIEVIDEVMLKLRKCYYLSCEVNEDDEINEQDDNENPQDFATYNSSLNFGETGLYCPIAYYKYNVLWEGKPEFSVKFDNKLYRLCKEENVEIFQTDVTKYQSYNKPFKTLPPLRICVIGGIGSGKSTVSKMIAKELGLVHVDFAEVLNDILLPRHFKKVGIKYENIFTDVPIDDEAVVDFQMDEGNESLIADIMSNETELRKMIFNYFERGSQILPQLMQKLITRLWFQKPFVNYGFVLDGYPKLSTDVEDMITCYCIPDLVIELESTSENTLARHATSMLKTWKMQLNEAKEKAREKLQKEKKEWMDFLVKNVVVKLIYDELVENMFLSPDPVKELSVESVILDANPSGSIIDPNLFNTFNEMIQEFPEPIDLSVWEKAEDVRERIDARLEGIFESDDENIQGLKELLEEQRIGLVTVNGSKSLTKVTRLALSKLANFRNRNESFFEETLAVSPDIAEILLSDGLCILSNKFNRMCPVYMYENPNVIHNIFTLSKLKNSVFPVVHRSYMYFIYGKGNLMKFRANPLKYVTDKSICEFVQYPLRIAVIGPPKSGKSTLSAKLAKRYGLICLSRGIAIRNVLENKHWTELGTKMLSTLSKGECVTTDDIMKAVQMTAMDHRSITHGFVFDGFPETASEAMQLDSDGIYPEIVIDITADVDYLADNSQKEIYYDILKRVPPYPRPLIENRYSKWNEFTYNIRSWINSDYQNLYKIDGNNSKWKCLEQGVNVIDDFITKVHNYFNKVKTDVVLVDYFCISNAEFESRMSDYKHMCPLCFRTQHLRHNGNPIVKKGVVQYKDKFYWICPDHIDSVLKNPLYLQPQKMDNIPELPLIVKRVNLSLVYERGICIVTYAEHLPTQMLVVGTTKYAASYGGHRYLFCSKLCHDKFLAKPHLYHDITVFRNATVSKPLTLKGLPNIGYLEQTVGIIITEACVSATVHRPKYPGLSYELSALLHIALYMKTHNRKIRGDMLEMYKKMSNCFNARCKVIQNVGLLLRSMDNPFAAYPKCCGHIESESGTLTKPSTSRVPVPDERYDYLVDFHKPASKVPAFLNVVDIAGLVRGAAEGQGLGNAFLSHIKACDAIFNLCRAFDDEDVIHVDGEVNPVRDLETIGEELRLKDEEQLMANYEKLDRVVARGGDKKLKPEYDALTRIKAVLVDEKKHIRFGDWSAADIEVINKYLFLTSKPALYLVNLSEKDYTRKKNKWLPKLKEWIDKNDPGAPLIPFSGVLEAKLMDMEPEERKAYLKENNITSALEKIIVQGYKALNLEYFFTAGPDEVKAWTIQKGTKAPQAAGRIHTDFEKGFIMAEVMHYKDFKEEGTEAACKAAGKYRQQGRNYVVEDGDIIFFKFNAGAGLKDAKKK